MRTFHYHIRGLQVSSELELPGLAHAPPPPGVEPHLQIMLDACVTPPASYSFGVSDEGFQISIPGVAQYLVRDGREIRIRSRGARETSVRVCLLGSAMGALLHQRGTLPLHASAVVVDGACVAFVGPCGMGKSTLCGFLAQRGHAVASDDVLALSPDANGALHASPGALPLRLRADVVRALRVKPHPPRRRGDWDEKHSVHVAFAPPAPFPLRCIYVIEESRSRTGELIETRDANALRAVLDNVYRIQFASALGCVDRTFALAAALTNQAAVFRLRRSPNLRYAEEVLDLLAEHWSSGAAWEH